MDRRCFIGTLATVGAAATVAPATFAQAAADVVPAAQATADAWLAALDAADYGATWDAAAVLFRNAVPRSQWEQAARSTRAPLGAVRERQAAGAQFTRTLPGAPDGEYVVIQYRTRFEHKAAATETVTPMRDADGQWRVAGYFVR
jgi:hypothetical protein